jgi:UDP-N-acetylglucosamine pyrophosphorylase/tRNA nucleotidyltransferase/poly(A) polymerase
MIPVEIKEILEKIESHGYEAYIVGGAVRDLYMNRPVSDWDIASNARPETVKSIFDKTLDTGIDFGTVKIKHKNSWVEMTTYRKDSLKSDGRRPDYVTYSNDLIEDLKRRDFTMNAMVMTKEGQIIDHFNGKKAINKKIIETVGDAKSRFNEDYLRVYRYVRFTSQLNFSPNPKLDQVILDSDLNKNISFERIQVEFNKILMSDHPSLGLKHLKDLGLLSYILPGMEKTYDFNQHSPYHHLDVFNHSIRAVDCTPKNLDLRLATLLHDIGKPETFILEEGSGHFYGHASESSKTAEIILKRLKYSNKQIKKVVLLIHHHMRLIDLNNEKSIRKFIRKLGTENIYPWLQLRRADMLSCKTQETMEDFNILADKIDAILNEAPPFTVNDLDIDGYDLMALGLKGPEIKTMKAFLLEYVDDHPGHNKKSELINKTKIIIKETSMIEKLQANIYQYMKTLESKEKEELLKDFKAFDLELIMKKYDKRDEKINSGDYDLKPIKGVSLSENEENIYRQKGLDLIKSKKVAAVLMAGGQGTRLGHEGPKGTFDIGLKSKKSLFEIHCDQLKNIYNMTNTYIPWYIMTSEDNHEETHEFFKSHNYFSYPKEKIIFFKQDRLPLVLENGDLALKSKSELNFAANGNGGVFTSLKSHGILNEMKSNGIELVFLFGVDNALAKICDPTFVGYMATENVDIASKAVDKTYASEKVGVMCYKNNKPSIIEYSEMKEALKSLKDENDKLIYRHANILAHMFKLEFLINCADLELPYHVAHKKISHYKEGAWIVPDHPNGYKFELFMFDVFEYADDMAVLSVSRNEEFAPVKNKSGKDSPETARELYEKHYRR